MKMYQLTTEQKDQLVGQFYDECSIFNPVQDINGSWFIGEAEMNSGVFEWLKNLQLIEFEPAVNS